MTSFHDSVPIRIAQRRSHERIGSTAIMHACKMRPSALLSRTIVKLLQYTESKSIEAGDFARGRAMLTIFGSRETSSFCDGLRRRDFIASAVCRWAA